MRCRIWSARDRLTRTCTPFLSVGDITAFAVTFEVRDRVYGDDGRAVDAQEAARIEPFF